MVRKLASQQIADVWNCAVLAQFHHQASSDGYSQGMVLSESAAILL